MWKTTLQKFFSRGNNQPVRRKPMIETLEDRAVPAVVVFNVDDDGVQKPGALTTIQEAIDLAALENPSDIKVIRVFDGTYNENLSISGSNGDKIKLVAKDKDAGIDTKIVGGTDAGNPNAPVIDINGSDRVVVKGFTIDGGAVQGNAGVGADAGVFIHGDGGATVRGNTFENFNRGDVVASTGNNRVGQAVRIGNSFNDNDPSNDDPGFAKVLWNTINDYHKSGILVEGLGSEGIISFNTVTGAGEQDVNIQNGIEIGDEGEGRVRFNTVTGANFTDPDFTLFTAAGILIDDTNVKTVVGGNTVTNNQTGIFIDGFDVGGIDGGHVIVHNTVTDNVQDGILLTDANGNKILRNVANRNGGVVFTTTNQVVNFDGSVDNPLVAGDILQGQLSWQNIGNVVAQGGSNQAMIFDTNNPTGGDTDLAYTDQGNAVIISEDGDTSDPDDNAGGGDLVFDFIKDVTLNTITILDIDNNETDGVVKTFDAHGDLINTTAIPTTGDNGSVVLSIGDSGVSSVVVWLEGSGAVSQLDFDYQIVDVDNSLGFGGGITLFDSSNNVIRNNTTNVNALDGIAIIGTLGSFTDGVDLDSSAVGNIIKWDNAMGNGFDGIYLEGTLDTEVLFNDLVLNQGNGLSLINADNTTIKYNDIIGNGGSGIFIDGDSAGTIEEDNVIVGNSGGTNGATAANENSADWLDYSSDDMDKADDLEDDYDDNDD